MQPKSLTRSSKGITALIVVMSSAILSVPTVKAIAPIGDNAELFVTGTVSGEYNDNIFLSHTNAKDDFIFDVIPGLSYEFGKVNSLTTGQLAVNEDLNFFTKKPHLNNQLFNGVFAMKYDDSKTSINFDASFHEADQAERGIQTSGFLVNRNLSHVDTIGEVQVTDKSSIGAGIIWDDTDYKTAGFTDWRYVQIPVNYYLKFEPKLDLSAGFRFQDNTVGVGGIDSNTYYYNVGARGEFTPNLTGKFTVGYINEKLDNGTNQGGLGAESSFTYAYSPKTNVTFGLNDDFGYAATGSSFRNFGTYVGFISSLTEQWTLNGQISYNRYKYVSTKQRDDFYSARLGLTYTISTHVSMTGSYSYTADNSNFSADSFKGNIFSISATVHY
jgi:hypothetical protein